MFLVRPCIESCAFLQSSLGSSSSTSFQSVGSYGPFGRMPAYSQFSPSPLVGQQFGAVGVGMFHFKNFFSLTSKLSTVLWSQWKSHCCHPIQQHFSHFCVSKSIRTNKNMRRVLRMTQVVDLVHQPVSQNIQPIVPRGQGLSLPSNTEFLRFTASEYVGSLNSSWLAAMNRPLLHISWPFKTVSTCDHLCLHWQWI